MQVAFENLYRRATGALEGANVCGEHRRFCTASRRRSASGFWAPRM